MIGWLLLACRIAPPDLPAATAIRGDADGAHVEITCTLHNTGDAALSQRVRAEASADGPPTVDEVLLEVPPHRTRAVVIAVPLPAGPAPPCGATEVCTTVNGVAVRARCLAAPQ